MIVIYKKLKMKSKELKSNIDILFLAYRKKETPIYAKIVAIIVVSYAISPIDLIPDFIPFLGYLDDLILVPLGIMLAYKLIPVDIIEKCRKEVKVKKENKRLGGNIAAGVIIALWLVIILKIVTRFLRLHN